MSRPRAATFASVLRSLLADGLHLYEGLAQILQPVVLPFGDEPDAPRERVAAAARDAGVDQVSSTCRSGRRSRVMAGTLTVVNRCRWSPASAPHETRRPNRCWASSAICMRLTRVSSRCPATREARAAARVSAVASAGELGLREGADDQDLVPVGRHDGGAHEPVGGDAAGEPALELIG